MKRFTTILLIVVYSLSTVGFTLKEFYCCGDLKNLSVATVDIAKYECDKSNETLGCCANEYKFHKVKTDHFVGDKIVIPAKYFTDGDLTISSYHHFTFIPQTVTVANSNNAPPLKSGIPIYIYNCVFRI